MRKNRGDGLQEIPDKLLLDTTYLLPLLGVSVRLPHFSTVFRSLIQRTLLFYNPLSLVEAKWIVLHYAKTGKEANLKTRLERYVLGLEALEAYNESLIPTPITSPEVERLADNLLIKAGVHDYFDRMVYATAAHLNLPLLTEDDMLRRLPGSHGDVSHPPFTISWKDLLKALED